MKRDNYIHILQQLLGALSMGAHGAVGSTYSFLPKLNQRIIQLHEEGRIAEARNEQLKSQKFYKVMAKYGNFLCSQYFTA